MKKRAISLFFGLALSLVGYSQMTELPLLYSIRSEYLHQASDNQDSIHLNYQSLYESDLSENNKIPYLYIDTLQDKKWIGRKLFYENLFILNKKNIYLTIDPLFNFSVGSDLADTSSNSLYQNTRGFKIEGVLGKKIIFQTSFLENQVRFPSYLNTFIDQNGVVPGMGRVKDFKNQDYDYSMASASIIWNATSFMRIKLANDKDFLGLGYRSILLSDNAFNYPHLKLDFWFAKRKFKYTLNYALLQDLIRLPQGETPESLFERKAGAFHYLSYMPNRKISIGIYSGTTFPRDPEGESDSYYVNVFMPIIFWNPLINPSSYIQKIGFDLSFNFSKTGQFYFELANNPANMEQFAYLAGVSFWDLFVPGLNFTFEYSAQKAYNKNDLVMPQLFSHYSQSLAHTLGSGFDELYMRLSYRYKRFNILSSINLAGRNMQDAQVWGFVDLDENALDNITDPVRSINFNTELYYMMNPKTNMNIAIGYRFRRSEMNNIFGKTDYLYLSFRTSIFNEYQDF